MDICLVIEDVLVESVRLFFSSDPQGSGAVHTAAAEDGCGHCGSLRFRQDHSVDTTEGCSEHHWELCQTLRHEPKGHASHTSKVYATFLVQFCTLSPSHAHTHTHTH